MPFTGKSCKKDPETGYLTPTHQGGGMIFGSDSKKRLLEVYEAEGNIAKACDTVGISSHAFYEHLHKDEAFARDYRITIKRMASNLESSMYKKALEANGTMDRFGWLRAHDPQKWNPASKVVVSQDNSSTEALFSKLKESGELIDVDPLS